MTKTQATATVPELDADTDTACLACRHPWEMHDAIATRYCRATTAGHRERGCVCGMAARQGALVPKGIG